MAEPSGLQITLAQILEDPPHLSHLTLEALNPEPIPKLLQPSTTTRTVRGQEEYLVH